MEAIDTAGTYFFSVLSLILGLERTVCICKQKYTGQTRFKRELRSMAEAHRQIAFVILKHIFHFQPPFGSLGNQSIIYYESLSILRTNFRIALYQCICEELISIRFKILRQYYNAIYFFNEPTDKTVFILRR